VSFSDLQEQAAVAEQLHRSLQRGRLAHAYLFTGPRGSGKEAYVDFEGNVLPW